MALSTELSNWLDSVKGAPGVKDGVCVHSGMTPKLNFRVLKEAKALLRESGMNYSVDELRTMSASKVANLVRKAL